MTYIECVNTLIRQAVAKPSPLVLFGQNIDAGSCIGGFTRNLSVAPGGKILNTTNTENSLCGFGFGLMMNGVSSIFFMKQLDFLLLGIDHLVNTYNIIRNMPSHLKASFTIMPIVVDNGYQGPQSSSNNLSDFCSIARIPAFTITNKYDAERIIPSKIVDPGFKIIAVSQRLFQEEILVPGSPVYVNDSSTVFQHSDGPEATIVCFNFSFPQGWKLYQTLLKDYRINASIFNVNSPVPTEWERILENARVSKRLITIDDSKSANVVCDALVAEAYSKVSLDASLVIKRKLPGNWLSPCSDEMEIDINQVVRACFNKKLII